MVEAADRGEEKEEEGGVRRQISFEHVAGKVCLASLYVDVDNCLKDYGVGTTSDSVTLNAATRGAQIQFVEVSTMSRQDALLLSEEVDRLSTLISESVRASRDGVRYFIEPTVGVLATAKNRRHHIIFGRRGSGKSSLLQKVASDLTVNRTPIAFVDLESFKGHSYPDVLVSVLIKSLTEIKSWLDTAATSPASKTTFWQRFFGSQPTRPAFNRARSSEISIEFGNLIEGLTALLHDAEDKKVKDTAHDETSADIKGVAKVGVPGADVSISTALAGRTGNERQSEYSSRKVEALHRNIMKYQAAFRDLTTLAEGPAYLLLDDLYHIRKSDQAAVVDYFHRIAKGTNVWLKVGTIRHRSNWYAYGNPPVGMKLGDDADEIDLDATLEKYESTKNFLQKILLQFAKESDLSLNDILADGARDRLVLASGGVARDFLTIFARSLSVARDRIQIGNLTRGGKVGAEDVNIAAGLQGQFKEEDFTRDSGDDQERLFSDFERVLNFCVDVNANCFLVEKDVARTAAPWVDELVDLKLLHRVRSRVTMRDSNRKGRLYDAFMLDLSRYTGERARRNFEMVKFWGRDSGDSLRRASLIFMETK